MSSDTIAYYDHNADHFFTTTACVDMRAVYERFLPYIPEGGSILDAGCGSGRDAKAFHEKGYAVTAFDASAELVQRAKLNTGLNVQHLTFAGVTDELAYDGVWACASLLHVPISDIPNTLAVLWSSLKYGGAFYLSFKLGLGERVHNGRRFTDADKSQLLEWSNSLPDVDSIQTWITEDQRQDRDDRWINAVILKRKRLITGGHSNPFLPHLLNAISSASTIEIAVAFTKSTGVNLLFNALEDAISRAADNSSTARPATHLRFLTSDYLDITDPDALRRLMLLKDHGADVRIYESAGGSFHLKTYIFTEELSDGTLKGRAFIGSSNISRQALQDGLEWNYRVDYPGTTGFFEAKSRFNDIFESARTKELTDRWIDAYESRRKPPTQQVESGSNEYLPPPHPTEIQKEALSALIETRNEGYRRGLVVLATGLGKTWLAAFDADQASARRILFVAHREEILSQAAETFLRIRPHARVGFYTGKQRDAQVDILCASIQTIGRADHLRKFSPNHFDYIVVDEFHHAAAPSYQKLLQHFDPLFLLGLTATPDRTDQSSILSLCDDNLVFTRTLVEGIQSLLLSPFHYYGIFDENVDYEDLPWRNGRFDIELLSNKLATENRANHVYRTWMEKRQRRTIAFCASIRHAEFMSDFFSERNVKSAAVYSNSPTPRADALRRLDEGALDVIFCVDLFNEGVDLPGIDTVMMLRPTESKIIFLQQLGRGLRRSPHKDHLVVLDFIGNHKGFLHKPQALAGKAMSRIEIANFARSIKNGSIDLPPGCLINYDLEIIDFMESLSSSSLTEDYEALRETLLRRPTITEFYRYGGSTTKVRQQYGDWFSFVKEMGDLSDEETNVLGSQRPLLHEIETTAMNKSFKMILLEAFQDLNGWQSPPSLAKLADQSWKVIQRKRNLISDIPDNLMNQDSSHQKRWLTYWISRPVNAWTGGNTEDQGTAIFDKTGDLFTYKDSIPVQSIDALSSLVQELIDFRLASYEARAPISLVAANPSPSPRLNLNELPFFPDLKIACGHFKNGSSENVEYRHISNKFGNVDPSKHFIARASGNSMNGGKNAIVDGDYLLLEHITPTNAGSITGLTLALERQDSTGDNQYLLRVIRKNSDGTYILHANNPNYEDIAVTPDAQEHLRTFARLRGVLSPLDLAVGQSFMREEIPALFGESFNTGKWMAGHIITQDRNSHILLVTINKQGKSDEHRFIDHWIDDKTFHWQSQNATTPDSPKGKQIINHDPLGIDIHLFIRENKLINGKAAPFEYFGEVAYKSHTGSSPMSIIFELKD
jgi:superfamily II DNA or RNA helicase/SAM-dependent methyltransferase